MRSHVPVPAAASPLASWSAQLRAPSLAPAWPPRPCPPSAPRLPLRSQVQRDGWSLEGDIVVMPRNAHNTPAQKRAVDMVPFSAVAPALLA